MTQTPAKGCVTNSTTTQEYYMSLADFCKSLPLGLTLAPIYRKGEKMESGAIATGKNPVEAAFKRNLNRDDAALILERSSKVSALGLFTGQKGNGVVILDVDANLTQLPRSGAIPWMALPASPQPGRTQRSLCFAFQRSCGVRSAAGCTAKSTTLATSACGAVRG